MYLLDTHILLWWLSGDKKLNRKIKELIENNEIQIFVSAVTCWEIALKKSLNKLKAPDNLIEILNSFDIKILPMTADHALYVEQLPFIHDDPFDRLLIAQCIVEDLTYITDDRAIHKYKVKILRNTAQESN